MDGVEEKWMVYCDGIHTDVWSKEKMMKCFILHYENV